MSDDTGRPGPWRRSWSMVGAVWRAVPAPLRRGIVLLIGVTIILLGLALIVLPGPFTLPLLLLGFAILASEFAWAGVVMQRTRREMERAGRLASKAMARVPRPRRRGGESGRAGSRGEGPGGEGEQSS